MRPIATFLMCDPSVLAEAVSELFSCLDDCKESIQHLNTYQVVFTRVSFDDFELLGSSITPPEWSPGL